ncbi:hypothetical protein BJ912DRAFT_240778 [Pholiota molesta]|nr:hypothetical protein BJ912DRAFT_240778 [Pholiota molesta]
MLSDLLSRHVNKCHANEKPLPNTGARRKGSASASRATTSKQACDQCVQLSLPCDGCNPCAKCVSRKCRCTFVKFHRQTAPAGPGHSARAPAPASASASSSSAGPAGGPLLSSAAALAAGMPMLSSAASTSSGLSSSAAASALGLPPRGGYDEDFLLGPPPASAAGASASGAGAGPPLATMAETLYHSNSFAFPALYPAAAPGAAAGELDYAAKYRAQAELFAGGGGPAGRAGGRG